MKRISATLLLLASALMAQAQVFYADFNHGQTSESHWEWIQDISVISPELRSDVKGRVTVEFTSARMTDFKALLWSQPTKSDANPYGHDVNLTPKGIKASKDGRYRFSFNADKFPHGPMNIRIFAENQKSGNRDFFELQLYNTGGVSWSEGIPETVPTGARGLKLIFEDDFDGPLSIADDGRGATYNAHKPRSGDFSGWPFTDVTSPLNPFFQRDSYLKIAARKPEGTPGSTGLLASVDMDGKGVWAAAPCYIECRFTAQSAPGTWPAFWTLNTIGDRPQCDELDVIEAYGGVGKGNPNHPGYSITSHYWNQKPGGVQKPDDATVVPMMELGGKSYWSTTFHTYGLYVGREWTVYYFDDIEVFRHRSNEDSVAHPLFFMINYSIGGISGWGIDLERYGNGSDMYVDYVRVYSGEE